MIKTISCGIRVTQSTVPCLTTSLQPFLGQITRVFIVALNPFRTAVPFGGHTNYNFVWFVPGTELQFKRVQGRTCVYVCARREYAKRIDNIKLQRDICNTCIPRDTALWCPFFPFAAL